MTETGTETGGGWMRGIRTRAVARCFAALAGASSLLTAQTPAADVPSRGVARVSLIAGDVSIRRGDTAEWVAAAVNGPLVVGDRVLAGAGSRAEVQLDSAHFVRVAESSEIRLLELERERYQVQLARGVMTLGVVRETNALTDINSPNVSIRPLRRGLYRTSAEETPDGPVTSISVRSGEAEIFTPRGTERLRAGRTVLVRGAVGDPEFRTMADLAEDDWDRWNVRRDRDLLRSRAYDYVSRDIYGAEVLDQYGDWIHTPLYGHVWAPRVAAGWSPYRHGRWSWVDYYGWTWISHDPWGWAPYHYGRWFWHSNRWCWWSGGPHARTFWRPALVAWVGWGGIGVGFGGGWRRVGWIPLGPYEPFCPWYGPGWYGANRRFPGPTIIHNVNITNIYRNSRVRDGITAVDGRRFGREAVDAVDPGALDQASLAQGPIPVPPNERSTRVTDREARAVGGAAGDRFSSRRAAAPVETVPFAEQRRNLEAASRSAFDSAVAAPPPPVPATSREERGGQRVQRESSVSGFGTVSTGESSVPAPATGGRRWVGEPGERWRRVGEAQGEAGGRSEYGAGTSPAFGADGETRSRQASDSWRRFEGSLTRSATESRQERGGLGSGRERGTGVAVSPGADSPVPAPSTDRQERDTWQRFEQRRGSVGGGYSVGGGRRADGDYGYQRGLERETGESGREGWVVDSPDPICSAPSNSRMERGGAPSRRESGGADPTDNSSYRSEPSRSRGYDRDAYGSRGYGTDGGSRGYGGDSGSRGYGARETTVPARGGWEGGSGGRSGESFGGRSRGDGNSGAGNGGSSGGSSRSGSAGSGSEWRGGGGGGGGRRGGH